MARLTRPVANDGDEQDAFSRWRRAYRWRPGVLRQIKRRANKRDRKDARLRINRSEED